MKTQGKIWKKVLGIAVVVLLVLIIAVYLFGEQALSAGVEKAASKALKVNVGLGGVQLGLLRGKIGISDLEVDNPEGYSAKTLLKLGSATVEAQMGSLLSDTVKIDQIRLDSIELTIEQKGLSTNLKDLLGNISEGKPSPDQEKPQEKTTEGKKLHIKTLEITNVMVKVRVLSGPEIPLKLDTITMENLGTDEPLDVAMLTGKVLAAIASAVAKQGTGIIPSDITGGLESGLQNIGKVSGELLEGGKDIGKGILDKGKDAGDMLKGVFQKKE
jgi:uncharacterized protein involved in outer membrane biogenesis